MSLDGSEPGRHSENGGVPRAPTRSRPASAALPAARHEERAGVSWDEQGIKTVHGGRGPRKITPERGVDGEELQEHSAPAALELGCAPIDTVFEKSTSAQVIKCQMGARQL